jgi:uncharacterized membrane protein
MVVVAHAGEGYGWGGVIEPWEIHPMLVHFPIAFLLGGVALDLYAGRRPERLGLVRTATGLLVAGVLTGVAAALAGVWAFFVVPAHTDEAHRLMYWHLGVQLAALVLFGYVAWVRWRDRAGAPTRAARVAGWVGALALTVGSGIGGYIVYHGGAGVEPRLLAPDLHGGHPHGDHDGSTAPDRGRTPPPDGRGHRH